MTLTADRDHRLLAMAVAAVAIAAGYAIAAHGARQIDRARLQ